MDGALGLGGDAVCAHTRHCPTTGRLAMLLTRFSLGRTTLRFVEFARDAWTVHSERVHVADGFTHVHDWALTPTHFVFVLPALEFDARAFFGGTGLLQSVRQARPPARPS